MKFLSAASANVDTRNAAANRVFERTPQWTDEDWEILCRAESRGNLVTLLEMIGAELCDEMPSLYQGLFGPGEQQWGARVRTWRPKAKLHQACSWAGTIGL